ncbi:hypothetical protein L1785_06005 [Antribacter sp. KLBMP9083]|uniref:Uncharacterized protein n=1 Tax=Antribacter soli TaxID=2910976 RepID=A0AA41U6Q0_9MICO|nr:hypothetical protein [Antribacter soli]MCF4120525.1 hypothetical protein [Antribacter soli]
MAAATLILPVLLAVITLGSGLAILRGTDPAGTSGREQVLGGLLLAGAAGLVLGFAWPWIGVVAAAGLAAYFVTTVVGRVRRTAVGVGQAALAAVLAVAVLALGVAGIARAGGAAGSGVATPDAPGPVSTLGPVPDDVLAALRVELRQGRTQYAGREAVLHITNDSAETLTLLDGSLDAEGFGPSTPTKPGRELVLRPGAGRDVYLRLGDPVCAPGDGAADAGEPAPSTPPAATVTVALGDGEGRGDPTAVGHPVDDPNGHLARNHAVDCAVTALAAGATLTVADTVRTEVGAGEPVAVVTVDVSPVPGGPEVRVTRIAGTTLMSAPGGIAAWEGAALAGQDAGRIELSVVPTRCDQHAVAEDKRGTFVPVHATVGGVEQHVVYLTMPDSARGDLYDFIGVACGWPAAG